MKAIQNNIFIFKKNYGILALNNYNPLEQFINKGRFMSMVKSAVDHRKGRKDLSSVHSSPAAKIVQP